MYGDELIVSNENIAAIQIMESSYSCNIFPILLTEIFLFFCGGGFNLFRVLRKILTELV